jgi:hypothetical protein
MMRQHRGPLPEWSRRGSAFLIAIGVLSVITLMILFFSNTRTARRWSTRLLSNESKAEAVAESAVTIGLRLIADQMNKDGTEWFVNLRVPCQLSNGGTALSSPGGGDIPMTPLADTEKVLGIVTSRDAVVDDYLGTLRSLMDNGSWTVRVTASLASAAAIADLGDGGAYHVAGINRKPVPVLGNVGKFVDSLAAPTGTSFPFTDLMSKYEFNIMLPNDHGSYTTEDDFSVKVKILFFKITLKGLIRLKLPRRITNPQEHTDKIEVSGYVKLGPLGTINFGPFSFNVYKDALAKTLEPAPPYLPKFSSRGLMKKLTGTDAWLNYSWGESRVRTYLNATWTVVDAFPGVDPGWRDDTAVEKVGAVRIRAEVFFEPQPGRLIQRTLAAERDFKIADMQPVAPEYVFFVNNSDDVDIKFIGLPPAVTATSSIHPVPRQGPDYKRSFSLLESAFGSGAVDEKTHLPGMIRINGTKNMAIHLFTGGLDESHTTHYNALMADHPDNLRLDAQNKVDPRFNWLGRPQLFMDCVYIPINPWNPGQEATHIKTGVINMWEVVKDNLNLNMPTMLFGDYMHEYPLNLQIESNLRQQYSRFAVRAKVEIDGNKAMGLMGNIPPMPDPPPDDQDLDDDAELPPELNGVTTSGIDIDAFKEVDKSTIEVRHIRMDEKFGIRLQKTTADATTFNPADPRSLPPALYSDLQYAKKAKHYYETAAAFAGDIANRTKNGAFVLDGVTFINDNMVTLNAMKFSGKGLIVARHNITVAGNLERADTNTVFGLIARNGAILVNSGVHKIQAACYSHQTLQNRAGNALIIDGNIVMDEFDRRLFSSVSVIYNGPACRTTFLSMVRDVGKYDPGRYHAVLGKQWSRYEYEKR